MRSSGTLSNITHWLLATLLLITAAGGAIYTATTGRLPDFACRQNHTDTALPLDDAPLIQTIRPTAGSFSSLTIYPRSVQDSPYSIFLIITSIEQPDTPLASLAQPLSNMRSGKLSFSFKALPADQDYQLKFSTNAPPETVFLGASLDDRYPDGALIQPNDIDQAKDLSFNAYYLPSMSRWQELLDHADNILPRWLAWTCLVSLVGFLVDFTVHPTSPSPSTISRLFLRSTGLGISLLILISYTQSLLKFPISETSMLIWGAGLVLAAAARWLYDRRKGLPSLSLPTPTWEDGLVLGLLLFAFTSRAIQTFDLEPVPLWVDGFNHYSKLSLLAQEGNLPLEINYPFGYHLLSYLAHLLNGLALPAAAFHAGFWISALSIPAAWPLARRIFDNPWVAALAVIFYGFLAPFPAYLATWSRFPFLLGITLLPLALDAALAWLEKSREPLSIEILNALPAALLTAGLLLSHYGTIVHYAAFLFALLAVWCIWPQLMNNDIPLRLLVLRLGGIALPALIILAWKITELVANRQWSAALLSNQTADQALDLRYALSQTTWHAGWLVWCLALIGLLAAIPWKICRKPAVLVSFWLAILYLIDILQILLLGTAVSSLMNFILALSMPLSWLAASALNGAANALQGLLPKGKIRNWIGPVTIFSLMACGFLGISGIINPVTILFTQQDRHAMEWIRKELPSDAVFYIDTFQWGTSITPSNGGGWITAFTGRGIIHPYIPEQREALQDFLTARDVDYIYTHNPAPLPDIPLFANAKPVFQTNNITIYDLDAPE